MSGRGEVSFGRILERTGYPVFREDLQRFDCQRCALAAGRTKLVIDRGNASARVMFIGEAPGRQEDLEGRAFVGRSGKLLDGMLAEMGFDTEQDALIANIVKCRPPANRPPKPEEAGECLPLLLKQIELVRPKLVVLLGATAAKHLVPDEGAKAMSDRVGRFFRNPGFGEADAMILFHPAYILRDPRKKPLMAAHLKALVERWRRTSRQTVDVHEGSC